MISRNRKVRTRWLARHGIPLLASFLAASSGAQEVVGEDTYILATGRRLPYLYGISLADAVDPANNNTSNAIVSRSKVALDRLDGRLLGDPAARAELGRRARERAVAEFSWERIGRDLLAIYGELAAGAGGRSDRDLRAQSESAT